MQNEQFEFNFVRCPVNKLCYYSQFKGGIELKFTGSAMPSMETFSEESSAKFYNPSGPIHPKIDIQM